MNPWKTPSTVGFLKLYYLGGGALLIASALGCGAGVPLPPASGAECEKLVQEWAAITQEMMADPFGQSEQERNAMNCEAFKIMDRLVEQNCWAFYPIYPSVSDIRQFLDEALRDACEE